MVHAEAMQEATNAKTLQAPSMIRQARANNRGFDVTLTIGPREASDRSWPAPTIGTFFHLLVMIFFIIKQSLFRHSESRFEHDKHLRTAKSCGFVSQQYEL